MSEIGPDRRNGNSAAPEGRKGFALPLAVFALVVVGVLVTGGFFLSQQESRISRATEQSTEALYVAERGLNDVLLEWDGKDMKLLADWATVTESGTTNEGQWSATITKSSEYHFFVDVTGTITEGGRYAGATRRLGLFTKMNTAQIDPPAALTTQGDLTVGGSTVIDGGDSIPDAYAGECTTVPQDDKPGVMTNDTTQITTQGNNHEVNGDPEPYAEDPSITSTSLLSFGEQDFYDLAAWAKASHTFPGGPTITGTSPSTRVVDGTTECDEGDSNNWGDPEDATGLCHDFYPMIYAPDGLRIQSNGVGQGILLVDGDLQVAGGFTFYGPVIVTGTVSTQGTGGHFYGGLIAGNVDLDTSTVLGDALVQYSSCAVQQALLNSGATRTRPLANRGWVDLTAVSN